MAAMRPNWLARVTTARLAPAVFAGLLGLAAAGQAVARAASTATGDAVAPYAAMVCLLALAGTVPLGVLRPIPAAVAITAANVTLFTLGALPAAAAAAQVIAAYRLGAADGRPGRLVRVPGATTQFLAVGLAVPFLVLALTSHANVAAVLLAALVPAAAGTGIAVRARRTDQTKTAALEEIAGALADHTARGERARIARELHDVVAHHISMIAVQAETARLTTAGLSATGAQRFTEIGDTARAGLTEMRRLLGVLRQDAEVTVPDRHPQPGLWQLTELIDAARAASGAGTRLIVSGPVTDLDPGVELAAYRIVQEALTNTRRHAPGAAVDVELRYTDDALWMRVRDNGPGPAGEASGHGLLGMRERALAVGGSLETGPGPGGGFRVEAMLPVKPEVS